MVAKRNGWALAGWCVVWGLVFWIGALFIAGFVVGAMDPANSATAGKKIGQLLSFPLLVAAAVLSTTLTLLGIMPGSRRKVVRYAAGEATDADVFATNRELEALEKLGSLHRDGVLTDDEFAAKKAVLLNRRI